MDKRRISVYLVIGLLLGSAGVVVGTHLTNTSTVTDGVSLGAPDGMNATITGETQAQLEQAFPDSSTVELRTEAGTITFSSNGPAWATVNKDDILGTETTVTNIDATSNDITIDPEDKQSITVGGGIDSISFKSASEVAIDDNTIDFVYSGSSASTVSLGGVPADTRIAAIDSTTNTIIDESTSNSNGEVTFDSLEDGSHDVYLQSFDPAAPSLSNPSPAGDLDSNPTEISIQVNDSDFDRSDMVDVVFNLDGTQIDSQTITANQTVTTSIPQSGQTGGSHSVSVEAQDAYGESRIDSFSYSVPDAIYIRNETNHSEILGANSDITVTFFGDQQTYQRQAPNGIVNMTGLPVNQDFIVEVDPSGNYTSRTVYIQSIYEQQDVYLLNTTAYNTLENRFVLEDPTGQFGTDTVFILEKPLNISGNTTWQTIHADEFGVEGVTATLQDSQRYRIKVMGADGTTQVVGPYRSDVAETVTVRPGTPTISLGEFTEGWAANAELNNRTLEYRYSDPTEETDSVTVWIHERGNESNQLQPNETYFNLGNFTAQSQLSENESEKTWAVKFVVDRGNEEFVVTKDTSNKADLVPDLSEEWRLITGIGLLLLLAGAFSMLNASVGAVVVSLVGGLLWWIGYLEGAASFAGIVLAIFISVVSHLYSSGRP